jgi:predicted RNA methylase
MPFTKFNLEHEDIEVMRAAFNRVCDLLHLDCGANDRITAVVATKIVELAKSGERDPERLCIDVLASLQETLQSTADEEPRETAQLGPGGGGPTIPD